MSSTPTDMDAIMQDSLDMVNEEAALSSPQSLVNNSPSGLEASAAADTSPDTSVASPTTVSTPEFSASFNDEMDLDSDSDLSSLATTPASSRKTREDSNEAVEEQLGGSLRAKLNDTIDPTSSTQVVDENQMTRDIVSPTFLPRQWHQWHAELVFANKANTARVEQILSSEQNPDDWQWPDGLRRSSRLNAKATAQISAAPVEPETPRKIAVPRKSRSTNKGKSPADNTSSENPAEETSSAAPVAARKKIAVPRNPNNKKGKSPADNPSSSASSAEDTSSAAPVATLKEIAVPRKSRNKKGKLAADNPFSSASSAEETSSAAPVATLKEIAVPRKSRNKKGKLPANTPSSSESFAEETSSAPVVPTSGMMVASSSTLDNSIVSEPVASGSAVDTPMGGTLPMTLESMTAALSMDAVSQTGTSSNNDADSIDDEPIAHGPSETPAARESVATGTNKRNAEDADFSNPDVEDADMDAENDTDPTPPRKKARKPRAEASTRARKTQKPPRDFHQMNLPEPYGKPPVWASTRQALAETLPYYRAYQSGAYTNDGTVYGLLIDAEGSHRDIFNEEVVITRCGGGKTLDKKTGKMAQTHDTENRSTHGAFKRNRDTKKPVAIIAGQQHTESPSKLPHCYNVLGWFHVTDVWSEETQNGIRVPMVRLEKINLSEKSWWAAAGTPLPDPQRDLDLVKPVLESCKTCTKPSEQIFAQGWTCLDSLCDAYFKFDILAGLTKEDFYDKMTYDRKFVDKRNKFQGAISQQLVPSLPSTAEVGSSLFGCESNFGKGVVCPKCLSCSRRTEWMQWSCENPNCTWILPAPRSTVSVSQAIGLLEVKKPKPEKHDPLIKCGLSTLGLYDIDTYIIPGETGKTEAGFVRHYRSKPAINSQPDGPDDLFRKMQEGEFELERKPCRLPGAPEEMFTNHYYLNFGAPYKFVAPVDSKAFSEAPPVILKSLMRMTWAGNQAVTANQQAFVPFNEIMAVGYFQRGSMGYHDDGESTLGPTVSSLSLGCTATMNFRRKKNSSIGGVAKNQKGLKPAMLSVTLNHGDLIVMHGSGIQKFYEHEVVPLGKLRFVLTCRYIVPEKVAEADREKSIEDGTLPDDIDQYRYSGDLSLLDSSGPEDDNTLATQAAVAYLVVQNNAGKLSAETRAYLQKLVA